MTFDTHTTTHEWISFLDDMNRITQTFDEKLVICPKPVMFRSAGSKRVWVQGAKRGIAVELVDGKLTESEGDAQIQNWVQGLTISGFHRVVRSSGVLAVFTNPLGNAIEQQVQKTVAWHTYAVFYQNGVLGIYDPSFVPGTELLSSCKGIALAKGVVKAFRGKGTGRKVTEVWVGGGGSDGVNGQEMTRSWIEMEVVVRRGADLGCWDQREGWMKVRF